MSKESGFLKSVFSVFSQDAVVTGINFLASIILARWLGPLGLGLFYVANFIPLYAEKFGRVGLIDHAAVYYIGKKKYGSGVAGGNLTLLFLGFSSVAFIGYALFQDQFHDAFFKASAVPHSYVWFSIATVPALLLIVAYGKLQLSLGLIRKYNTTQIVRAGMFLVLILVFRRWGFDFLGAILAGLVSVWAAVMFAGRSLWFLDKFSFRLNFDFVRDVFTFGWKVYVVTILQFLQQRLDLVIIAFYLSKSDVSYYSLAVGVSALLLKMPAAAATLLYPRITRAEPSEAAIFTARVCRADLLFSIVGGILIAVFAAPVVALFFGADYAGLVPPLLVLIPGTILLGASRFLTEYFYGVGMPSVLIVPGLVTAGLNAGLNLLFTPSGGISTAALISSVTYALYFVWLAIRFCRSSGVGARELLFTSLQKPL